MKRFHVHVGVADLEENIRFYSTLFGAAPSVVKNDYAKWMLDDPRINFAISQRGSRHGVNHLGMQVDSSEELTAMQSQLAAADSTMTTESGANCCYANSDKLWTTDPQGVAWETFHSLGSIPLFSGEESAAADSGAASKVDASIASTAKASCCAPSQGAATSHDATTRACCA
ncbi:MAG: ArsI/CadI family heavy metal resistance metalloenzyme [Burkholderiaceae bacterium]